MSLLLLAEGVEQSAEGASPDGKEGKRSFL